ncbi:hypothetical protein [Halorubellus sp. PRR65]|uniref:hypothetical protein n=1 Tax=Halorubellus sp. PRR65 TaxID=3098148 RepID=UPI002B25B1BC|nr:hypothetical protein [Halorubellus sp. PRR65]
MVALVSPLAVAVLADLALLLCWTAGLFWRYGRGVDWSFLRSPFDSRYGAVAAVFGLYLLLALLTHAAFWLTPVSSEFAPSDVLMATASLGIGLFFLVGYGGMYPDVDELAAAGDATTSVAAERFFQVWIRGIGWTFLTVASTSVLVPRAFGPVVW